MKLNQNEMTALEWCEPEQGTADASLPIAQGRNFKMDLVNSLWNLMAAFGVFAWVLLTTLLPWLPLFAWIAFWLFAVNWKELYPTLARGGAIGVVLIALLTVFVWGTLSPPAAGHHYLLGLHVTNLIGKLVYVSGLLIIAMLCGSVQLGSRRQ